jgi:transketolase
MTFADTGKKDTRSGFGVGLLELGRRNPKVVALCADLTGSLKMDAFEKEFPERFIQCGVAEANMIGMAAGLTLHGYIPFTGTFANFSTGRVFDQIRQSVCYSGRPVKIAASHAGLTLGEDGATHQILEDIGLMKMLPGMSVIVPCDYNQTRLATLAAAEWPGALYLRFGRPNWPNFTPAEDHSFTIGKAQVLRPGTDATLVACGHLVWTSLQAAEQLSKEGISVEVINLHTIKPLDEAAILASVGKTGCIITAEEHQRIGGMGESVAGVLARYLPAPQEYVAVDDSFGESGTPDELLIKYGLGQANVVAAVHRALHRKAS